MNKVGGNYNTYRIEDRAPTDIIKELDSLEKRRKAIVKDIMSNGGTRQGKAYAKIIIGQRK